MRISLDHIAPDPGQPRKTFAPGALEELAASIAANGLICPISVRPADQAGKYTVIAGERRWRAHCLLRDRGDRRFAKIEALVVDGRDLVDVRVAQLVENIQRADMPILEESAALAELHQNHGLSVEQISERLGLAEFRVRWRLQLLQLAPDVRQLVAGEHLDRQQAMEIARLPNHADQRRIVRMINRRELVGWKSTRNAVEAILQQTTPADLFGDDMPRSSAKETAVVRGMEDKVERVVALLNAGWHAGECIVAAKVSPNRAALLADKLAAIKGTVSRMERELRNLSAQAKIALAG